MGYCMQMMGGFIVNPADKAAAALAAVKTIPLNCYSWVDMDRVRSAEQLVDAVRSWRWDARVLEDGEYNASVGAVGDIIVDGFYGDKSGDDHVLFGALAPFVNDGDSIEMMGEDGARWRWLFRGGKCVEQAGRIVYDEEV